MLKQQRDIVIYNNNIVPNECLRYILRFQLIDAEASAQLGHPIVKLIERRCAARISAMQLIAALRCGQVLNHFNLSESDSN